MSGGGGKEGEGTGPNSFFIFYAVTPFGNRVTVMGDTGRVVRRLTLKLPVADHVGP